MVSPIARGAAELARRASTVIGDDTARIGFGVWYHEDSQWIFEDALRDLGRFAEEANWSIAGTEHGGGEWTETLTSGAFGHAVVMVATRIRGHHSSSPELPLRRTEDEPTRSTLEVWLGTSRPNPSLLHGGFRTVELMVRLPVALPKVRRRDGVTMARIIESVTAAASRNDWRMLFLQAPTAPPLPEVERSGDYCAIIDTAHDASWPFARSFALRFAVLTPAEDVAERVAFFERLQKLCADIGAELSIGDYRGDRRGGQWVHALSTDKKRYRRRRDAQQSVNRQEMTHGLPLTFVGPARAGTSAEVLRPLVLQGLPIISASIAVLEELAFIHVLLGLTSRYELQDAHLRHGPAADVIRALGNAEPSLLRALDYHGMVGQPKPIELSPDEPPLVAWASWRLPDRPGALDTAMTTLKAALSAHLDASGVSVADVNIEYILCRRVESGDLRGRCKLALPAKTDTAPDPRAQGRYRNELCEAVETTWQEALARAFEPATVDADFTWQEWRLGRWHTLLPAIDR